MGVGMDGLRFELRPVEERPRRRSKYDPIIDEFLEGKWDLAEVEVEGEDPQCLRAALFQRIKSRRLLDRVRVFQSGGSVYLKRLR